MPNLIVLSGPYGPMLALLALVVLFVTARATWTVLRSPGSGAPAQLERMNALLFWGTVAAVLGLLGQCGGAYEAVSAILVAPEISPAVVAEGFAISFVPTLFGMGIFGFALAAYVCLRLVAGSGAPRADLMGSALFLFLLLPAGCSGQGPEETPNAITDGVWSFDTGPDEFLWEFSEVGGEMTCLVHDIAGSVKLNETPCKSAEMDGNTVRVSMDTGVRLEGEVILERGILVGHLFYPNGSETEVELPFHTRGRYPVLRARQDSARYAYRSPAGETGGWPVASADEMGMDPEALEEMVAAVDRGEAGVLHSLLVARGGRLVLAEYFHGYGPEDPHHLASCTKSVSSLLVGLARDQGRIPGVDVRVADFFPEDPDVLGDGWDRLTLENLLTMSLALDWTPDEAENLHGTGPEFFRRVLSHSVAGTPGQDWAYVSANVNLIAGIIHQATGEQADAFARHTLFEPLGFGAWNWEGMKTDGYPLMDGSLRLLPRDMAKLGQLVLDGGLWEGRQIVSEEWMQRSTAFHLNAGGPEGYGYLWWRMDAPGPGGETVPAIFANGWGSQFIAIFPTLDLVVVTTGGNEYNGKHMAVAGAIGRYILPGVRP